MSEPGGGAPDDPLAAPASGNPFVGPRPLESGERLYGREREIAELGYCLNTDRVVLFHSPSGAGKTSLIQAGLLHDLGSSFDVCGPTRVNREPIGGGANRYVASAIAGFEMAIRPSAGDLAGLTLPSYFADRPQRRSAPNRLLIFDQFEEILTVDPLATAAKEAFFDQLGELLRDRRIWALLVLREDYLAPLDPYAWRVPTQLENRFRIDLLDLDSAHQAMVETARAGGREFPAADRLVHDLATMKVQQPGGSFEEQTGAHVEPVQLQVVCRRLWGAMPADDLSIDEQDLVDFGDVDQALGAYYDESVARIATGSEVAERRVRKWFDERLITASGVRGQVQKESEASAGLANEEIEQLLDNHLVRAERRAGRTWFELAHDRLIEPVRESNHAWRERHLSEVQQRAALWEEQDRPTALLLRGWELEIGKRWAATHKGSLTDVERRFLTESRRARRARLIRGVAIAAIIALALGWALDWARDLRQRLSAALAAALAAKAQALAETEPRKAMLLGIEALDLATEPAAGRDAEEPLRRALARSGGRFLAGPAERFVAVDPSSRWLLTSSRDGATNLWDLDQASRVPAVSVAIDSDKILPILGPKGRWLAFTQAVGAVLWDLHAGKRYAFPGQVRMVEISPDGRRLLTDTPESLRFWDLTARDPSAQPLFEHSGGTSFTLLKFSPEGDRLAAGRNDGNVQIWDVAGEVITPISMLSEQHGELVDDLDFSADGRWLVSHSADRTVLWNLKTGGPPDHIKPYGGIADAAFSAGGRELVTLHHNGDLRLWPLEGGLSDMGPFTGCSERGGEITTSPDRRWLAIGCSDLPTRLLAYPDSRAAGGPFELKTELSAAELAFSPDSRWLVTRDGRTAALFDLSSAEPGKFSIELRGHENDIDGFALGPSGRWLVTWTKQDPMRIWELTANDPAGIAEPRVFRIPGDIVSRPVALGPGGRWLATAQVDSTRFWVFDGESPFETFEIETGPTAALAFAADGGALVIGGPDFGVRIWDAVRRDFEPLPESAGEITDAVHLAASPNRRWLVTVASDRLPVVRDLDESATKVDPLRRHKGDVTAQFSSDNRWLITVGREKARLFQVGDLPFGTPRVLKSVSAAAFSPDSRWLLTGDVDQRAVLWRLPVTGEKSKHTFSHTEAISAVAAGADASQLATGGRDGSILLWRRSAAGLERLPLPHLHRAEVLALAFTPDGKRLVSLGADGIVLLWSLRLEDLKKIACRVAGRNLTPEQWREYLGSERYRKTCPELSGATD